MKLSIVSTGIANIASLEAAFSRLGYSCKVTHDIHDVESANPLVLPGVGNFGAGMQMLKQHGLLDPLKERIASGLPMLAICLGMQLLARKSEESPEENGLDIFDTAVTHFPDTVRTPQFGWNMVNPQGSSFIQTAGYAYFANSYRYTSVPEGWTPSFSEHGGSFVSALEKGGILCCQFHPELSGAWGEEILRQWLKKGKDN